MITDKLKEEIFEISKEERSVNELFSWQGKMKRHKFACAVYFEENGKKRFIDGEWSDYLKDVKQWLGFKEDLGKFLSSMKTFGLMDLLFFIDTRHRCKCFGMDLWKVISRTFKEEDVINTVLKDSRGILLWHYQLDNLIRLSCAKSYRVEEIRNGLNHMKEKYWKMSKKLRVDGGDRLYDIIKERMFLEDRSCTMPPRFKFANNLHEVLDVSA